MKRISNEMNSKKRNMIKKILEKLTKRNENDKNLAELQLICRALRCAWGRIAKCPREYPYQILGRLFDARDNMQAVHFFLEKVEESAQKPWLRPLHQCLQDPREGPEVEVYFNSSCSSVAYFPCGKKVAAAVGNEVRVIDLQCGETLATYSGHEEPVRIATVSSNGKWLISADDQDIRVWENEIGRQVRNPIVCENSVEPNDGSLVIRGRSQDLEGSKVLEGSTDLEIFGIVKQHVEAWKPFSERNVLYNIDETTSYIAFSADGRELVCATVGAKVVRVLKMNNMHTNAEEMKCPPECGYVSCLAVSQDAKSITCGTRAGKIVFWDRNSDELQGAELSGHSGAVIALEISKNAQWLLSGSADGGVRMWDLRKREKPAILIGKHSDVVTSLAVSPDGKRLVSGSHDRTLRFWDLTKDTCANDGNLHSNCHSGPVTCISSSPDGRFVFSGSEDMEVRVWDAKNGKILGKPLIGHEKSIEKVDVSRDSIVVYSYADHVALCWKMDDEDMEIRTQCPLSTFVKRKYTDKDNNSLSLQKKQNNVVECNYKSADGKEFILAQMPTQKESLQWHIDHVGKVVYVGRQDDTLMVSKVQR